MTTPEPDRLSAADQPRRRRHAEGPHVLEVTGVPAATIGEVAALHGIALHDLHPATASLEEAYMNLTHASVTHRGTPVLTGSAAR